MPGRGIEQAICLYAQVIHYFLELVKSTTQLTPEQLVASLHLLIIPLLERSFAMDQPQVATNADVETIVKHLFDPPDEIAGAPSMHILS